MTKTKLNSYTILLISISCLTLIPIIKAQAQVMPFEDAIDQINNNEYNLWKRGYTITNPTYNHKSEEHDISGYLMWVAANGTAYQIDYSTLGVMNEIGFLEKSNIYNKTSGYYLWILEKDLQTANPPITWMLAHNGTIVYERPPILGPTPTPLIPQEIIYGLIMTIGVLVIVSLGIFAYYKKYKK